jgi:uncharacterized protein
MGESKLEVTAMTEAECRVLLASARLGRIAFTFRDRVDIQPLNYLIEDDWLFGRTSPGGKLTTIRHNRWVALQVDRVETPWEWESVVVRGTFHDLSEDDSAEGRELLERATALIRDALPESFTPEDPVPHRMVVFGIAIQELQGRKGRLVDV